MNSSDMVCFVQRDFVTGNMEQTRVPIGLMLFMLHVYYKSHISIKYQVRLDDT